MKGLDEFSKILFARKERKTLRQLLEEGPVFAPTVWDCISAKIVEQVGFQAMCLSGAEVAASHCGLPDLGLVTFDELVSVVDHITDVIPLPMIVDIDTGFGNELNVMRTCERVAKAGAMAVHLEDQTFPKRCGHLRGKEVISYEDFMGKVEAAAFALKGTGCALIARTDSYHVLGLEEAIRRCNGAIDTGADITFVEGTSTIEDIKEVGKRVKGPKMFAMASAGASPKVSLRQAYEWGYGLTTMHYAMSGALMGITEYGRQCYDSMSDIPVTEDPRVDSSPMYLFELFGIHEWLKLGSRFNKKISDAKEVKSGVSPKIGKGNDE